MSSRLKYIVIDDVFPILFGDYLKHSQAAAVARAWGKPVTSAGFCHITKDGNVSVCGESVSLKLTVQPGDAALIAKLLDTK